MLAAVLGAVRVGQWFVAPMMATWAIDVQAIAIQAIPTQAIDTDAAAMRIRLCLVITV